MPCQDGDRETGRRQAECEETPNHTAAHPPDPGWGAGRVGLCRQSTGAVSVAGEVLNGSLEDGARRESCSRWRVW